MNEAEIRRALEHHWAVHPDQDALHAIYAPNVRVDFPQSGESILGRDNLKAMRSAYPAEVTFAMVAGWAEEPVNTPRDHPVGRSRSA